MVSLSPVAALVALVGFAVPSNPGALAGFLAPDPATVTALQVLFLGGLIDFLYQILELVWLITRIFSLIGGGGG